MFPSGAKYGRWGTRLRMNVSVSPFSDLPALGTNLLLDHPLPRPNGVAVVLPIGNPEANNRTAPHYGLGIASTADGTTTAYFAASTGSITLNHVVNDEQVEGYADNLKFVEVEFSTEGNGFNATRPVAPSRGLYIRHIAFDTRVAGGCDAENPLSCGTGKTCIAINRAASDGICVDSGGTLADGATCTEDAITGASGCMQGSVCGKVGAADSAFRCFKRCDQYSNIKQCPGSAVCDAFGVCVSPTATSEGLHHAEIPIGGDCGSFDGLTEETSTTCGGGGGASGALGICLDVDGAANQRTARCLPWVRGRGDCFRMGMSPGSGGGRNDYSRIFCFEGFPVTWAEPELNAGAPMSDASDAR